jgi:PelA/Pel-15E family pectate lyase
MFVQTDALTLQPASARNYEMPSQADRESAKIMQFLIEHYAKLEKVSPE